MNINNRSHTKFLTLPVSMLNNLSLSVVRDDTPFTGHSNVYGWPSTDHAQSLITMKITKKAKLQLLSLEEREA